MLKFQAASLDSSHVRQFVHISLTCLLEKQHLNLDRNMLVKFWCTWILLEIQSFCHLRMMKAYEYGVFLVQEKHV